MIFHRPDDISSNPPAKPTGPEFYKALSVENLNARHRRIIDMHLQGMKNVVIAEALQIDKQVVSMVVNSPAAQEELARLREKVEDAVIEVIADPMRSARDILEKALPDAASTVTRLLCSDRDSIRLKASQDIMDRLGLSSRGNQTVGGIVLNIDVSSNLMQAFAESGGNPNEIATVERPTDSCTPAPSATKSLLSS